MIETGKSKWFGCNLRTFSLALLVAGLMTVVALWLSTTRLWPGGGWRAWAAYGAALLAASLPVVTAHAIVRAFRRRRWATLAVVCSTIIAASFGLILARNRFLPWTTIEGRVVYDSTGLPAAEVTVHLQPTHTSLARAYGPPSGDERLALARLLACGPDVVTDAEGRYCFRSVPFEVSARRPD